MAASRHCSTSSRAAARAAEFAALPMAGKAEPGEAGDEEPQEHGGYVRILFFYQERNCDFDTLVPNRLACVAHQNKTRLQSVISFCSHWPDEPLATEPS